MVTVFLNGESPRICVIITWIILLKMSLFISIVTLWKIIQFLIAFSKSLATFKHMYFVLTLSFFILLWWYIPKSYILWEMGQWPVPPIVLFLSGGGDAGLSPLSLKGTELPSIELRGLKWRLFKEFDNYFMLAENAVVEFLKWSSPDILK